MQFKYFKMRKMSIGISIDDFISRIGSEISISNQLLGMDQLLQKIDQWDKIKSVVEWRMHIYVKL